MVRAGASWSGRERNSVFLNLEGGDFANVSAISGLDWQDDGRALAVCDWDRDGDLDLWLKNRTGPQLRYMKNTNSNGNFISLSLEGADCNRDAIGARVEVWVSGKPLVQTVQAGSGYLAQSSKRLHFGLDNATRIERIEVHWPNGEKETLPPANVGTFYQYRQGSGRMQSRLGNNRLNSTPKTTAKQDVSRDEKFDNRTLLRQPFPLPDNWLGDGIDQTTEMTLVTFWAQWCPICRQELTEFGKHEDRLRQTGIQIIPVNLDPAEDVEMAREVALSFGFEAEFRSLSLPQSSLMAAIFRSVLDVHTDISIPMNLLLDSEGKIVAIYRGPVSVDEIVSDRNALAADATPQTIGSGKWVVPATRRYSDIVNELKSADLREWARYYLLLDRQAKGR